MFPLSMNGEPVWLRGAHHTPKSSGECGYPFAAISDNQIAPVFSPIGCRTGLEAISRRNDLFPDEMQPNHLWLIPGIEMAIHRITHLRA